jgi:hypothetical protein
LLSGNVDVEIKRCVEIGNWPVDVEEVVVQEQSEVLFSSDWLLELTFGWG